MKNYPKIYNNDIKVLGRVVSIATENKVAAAEQVFDEKFKYVELDSYSWDNVDLTEAGLDQYTINRLFGKKLKKLDDNIKFDDEGWIIDLKVRTLEVDNLKVNNTATIKDLHVTNNAQFDGNVNIAGDLIVKNTNIGDKIDWITKVITGEDQTSELWTVVKKLRQDVDGLLECCEEVREIINNLPTGAGDASFTVSPKSVELAPGETAQITVTKGADLTGTVRFTSNNTNIATVSASGVITAVADGTTTITVSVDGFRPTQDVTVKVTTPTPTYRVTFNPNNGQPSFYQDKLEGEKLIAVTDPVKEGYTFNGWHVNSDTGAVWNFNDPVTSTMMLIAGYTQNEVPKYTLTYKDGNTTLSTQQYEAGQSITPIADPTKSGYTFNGWSPSVPVTMPANDLTVTAQWTEVIVPETHVYTLEVDPTSTTITAGNTATITATPKDNGTPMSGQTITWSSSNTSAATVSNGVVTAITEGTATITATWTSPDGNKTVTCAITVTAEPTYTLTFDTAGGSAIAARTYKAGATIEAVTPPTKEGYNFTGWTPAIPATMPANNLTVVAQWEEIPVETHLVIEPQINPGFVEENGQLSVHQTQSGQFNAYVVNGSTNQKTPVSVTWSSSVEDVRIHSEQNDDPNNTGVGTFTLFGTDVRTPSLTPRQVTITGTHPEYGSASRTVLLEPIAGPHWPITSITADNVEATIGDTGLSIQRSYVVNNDPNCYNYNTSPIIEFTSSDESVFTVGETGNITIIGLGTATCNIVTKYEVDAFNINYQSVNHVNTTESTGATTTCTVTVTEVPVVHDYDLSLDYTRMDLTVGQNDNNVITATCKDNDVVIPNPENPVTWNSSNTSVATVSGGTVTPVAAGTTTVTATWEGKQKTCQVVVTEPQPQTTYAISLNRDAMTLRALDPTEDIIATCTVDGVATTEGTVTWTSSNDNIATVTAHTPAGSIAGGLGRVKPRNDGGNVTITASWNGVSATCQVTVLEAPLGVSLGDANVEVQLNADQGDTQWVAINEPGSLRPYYSLTKGQDINEVFNALDGYIITGVNYDWEGADPTSTSEDISADGQTLTLSLQGVQSSGYIYVQTEEA